MKERIVTSHNNNKKIVYNNNDFFLDCLDQFNEKFINELKSDIFVKDKNGHTTVNYFNFAKHAIEVQNDILKERKNG